MLFNISLVVCFWWWAILSRLLILNSVVRFVSVSVLMLSIALVMAFDVAVVADFICSDSILALSF